MRATFIYHPGGGSAEVSEIEQARTCLEHAFELDALLVEEGQNPHQLAQTALAKGSSLLIACGGDGTVSAVASALVGRTDARLGILPRGTANSIATHFGIPSNLQEACRIIAHGTDRIIDTAQVNGRCMVLMATLGVHAEAITQVDPARKRKYGVLAYVLEELERMAGDSRFVATIEVDGTRHTFEASAITVANLAPPHTLAAQGPDKLIDDDGKLDVTLIALDGWTDALATSFHLATHAFTQRPATRDNIAYFRTREVTIETQEPKVLMVDGEAHGETPVRVRIVPRSLCVRVPAESNPA